MSDAYLETQYKVLESEDLADRVIAQLGLDKVAEFHPVARSWPWTKDLSASGANNPGCRRITRHDGRCCKGSRSYAIFRTGRNIKPVRRSRAVEIEFDSQDPTLAARRGS